jgi:hypothetical protein
MPTSRLEEGLPENNAQNKNIVALEQRSIPRIWLDEPGTGGQATERALEQRAIYSARDNKKHFNRNSLVRLRQQLL